MKYFTPKKFVKFYITSCVLWTATSAEGYVLMSVCLFVCLFVPPARLLKKFWMDFDEIFLERQGVTEGPND